MNAQLLARPPVLFRFLSIAIVYAGFLGLASAYVFGTAAASLLVFAVIVTVVGYGITQSYMFHRFGLCNAVTLGRAAAVAFLVGAVVSGSASAWIVFGVAAIAFALDGADGWLARRSGLASDFGARFDMETDAGLAAVLSLWVWTNGITGPEILVLGFMRYAFVLASFQWSFLRAPLPESFRRKAICVVQIGALILLAFPMMPTGLSSAFAYIAALLLTWSFVVDIVWLARRAG
ncbi:CDP-alcohol phosphatidyltransferase family protein [Tateyamaria sp. ANG-S1]|uniref:CDP-alcohol phosphatidyltransferase family protein n=1 Tax=Tateyamaria sp. ANG-S1 TaxID=1577905 RepID=UPI00068FF8F3|nr:CDP-alcohol phosphatidyltransferase family protein [Tateyamaria sp. ANG-S1]